MSSEVGWQVSLFLSLSLCPPSPFSIFLSYATKKRGKGWLLGAVGSVLALSQSNNPGGKEKGGK